MTSNRISARPLIPAGLCLLLSIGTFSVFHACEAKEDGTWMHCHEAQNAVVLGSLVLMAVLILAGIIQKKPLRIAGYALGIAGAAALFLIPGGIIQMCLLHTMRCYAVMQPFVRILSVLIAAACLAEFVGAVRK